MLEAINAWGDYKSKVREFDAVLEHSKAVATGLAGSAAPSLHANYGGQIFIKLLSHAVAMRSLAADSSQRYKGLLDVPSMCALARCVVEAHDVFEYVAGHDITASERGFRIRLWELHDKNRQLKLSGDMDLAAPRIDQLRAQAAQCQAELEGHEFLASLHPDLQALLRQRMAKGDAPAFHLDHRQRCALSGVDADWHNAVTMQLSQYVHTLPSSVGQVAETPIETLEALRLLALPLLFTLPFLVRVTQGMSRLMPDNPPEPPSRTARTMTAWRALAERGSQRPD